MDKEKYTKILDLNDKIPTAAQTRKFLKDEWHSWSPIQQIIAAVVLLPTDVFISISGDHTLRYRFGKGADLAELREYSQLRLNNLISLLNNITIDIKKYEEYAEGSGQTPEGEIPLEFRWSMKRHNDYVRLMQFVNEIDVHRKKSRIEQMLDKLFPID